MFEKLLNNKKIGSVKCIIWGNGQIIYQKNFGYRNPETYEIMSSTLKEIFFKKLNYTVKQRRFCCFFWRFQIFNLFS